MRLYCRAMGYFIPDVLLIALLVVLIGLSVCVALLEAWPLAILIDSVLNANPRGDRVHDVVLSVLPQDRVGQILGLVLLTLALQCIGYAVWLGRMMVNAYLSAHGTARVRCDLFSKLQGLGLAYHQRHPKGDATYRLMTDVAGPWGIMELVIGTGVAAITLVIITAILFVRSAPLTVAAFAVGPLMITSNWYFARRILKDSLASKQADAALTSLIQQSIATVSLTRAFGREAHELGRFSAHVDRSNGALISLSWQEQLYPFVRDAILAVSAAIIFGYGGYLVYRDQFADPVSGGMTVGALVVFMDYTRKLWDPLKWLTEFVAKVQYHAAACRRVFDVLDTPDTVEEAPNAIALPVKPRALVLDRVSFEYGAGQMILHNLSARIRPGEMVGFVGPSGTGKSTVLNLMMRAYDPTGGALRLDNIDLRQLRFADLRQHMAVVGQDHALLPLSVADNIAYGRPHATRQEILRAAKLAGAAEFIAGLPEGYDTLLCEGGQNLSGGQRQRLAIARALLTEAPILILDEPTSALDPVHEQHLIDTLHSLRGLRTIVLVTHRLESVVDCDQIYIMDAGRIVEHGHHAALLAERGRYSRLWQRLDAPAKPPLPVAAVA